MKGDLKLVGMLRDVKTEKTLFKFAVIENIVKCHEDKQL